MCFFLALLPKWDTSLDLPEAVSATRPQESPPEDDAKTKRRQEREIHDDLLGALDPAVPEAISASQITNALQA